MEQIQQLSIPAISASTAFDATSSLSAQFPTLHIYTADELRAHVRMQASEFSATLGTALPLEIPRSCPPPSFDDVP